MTLDVEQLTLNVMLVILYLCATPLEPFELVNIGAVPVDVSNHPRVAKGNDYIINKFKHSVGRVENGVVRVLGTRASKVRRGERTSMQREGVHCGTLLASAQEACLISFCLEQNVSHSFGLTELIDKDKGVLTRIGGIVLLPSISWVIGIEGEGDGVVRGQGFEAGEARVTQGKRDLLGDR